MPKQTRSNPAFKPHNHQRCIKRAMEEAEQLCSERKLRLTPLRQQVLKLIWSSHRPIGAYALLDQLETPASQRRPAPPTVYRALDFLLENGLIHRIASLNAFIGCCTPGTPHSGNFLICRKCSVVIELDGPAIHAPLSKSAKALGFSLEQASTEATGLCPNCQGDEV